MHPRCKSVSVFVYGLYMANRRARRRTTKAQRHAPSSAHAGSLLNVREATRVERLAYTRTQAAEALGFSRSTFDRRVLPLLETVEMPWGTKLIPVDEVERFVAQRRRAARREAESVAKPGRPATLPPQLVARVRAAHVGGASLAQIARDLNAKGVSTAHGGARWWPSTVRAVIRRRSADPAEQA